jgi:hypothetical protein
MGTYSQIALARELWLDEHQFRQRHPAPFLVWSAGAPSAIPIIAPTSVGRSEAPERPRTGEPLILEVVKGELSAFAFGVTIGRTENNDVVVRHEAVSRFHAFIQEREGQRLLVDCGSRNGTFLDGRRLDPNKPSPLPEVASIGLGQLRLEYLSAEKMQAYLRGQLKLPGGPAAPEKD